MGGDFAPREPVAGALLALRQAADLEIVLVGDEARVRREVARALRRGGYRGTAGDVDGRLRIVHAPDAVPDGGHPAAFMRAHPDTSVALAARLAAAGEADAALSVGHTGAGLIAASWHMGLLPGVERPTAGVHFPFAPRSVMVDLGLNPEPKPHQLFVFGVLGAAYARVMLGVRDPSVALLSNGTEEGKGTETVRRAYEIMKRSHLRFIGNIEGLDVVTGRANVIVTDGFTGNVMIKFLEGFSAHLIRRCRTLAGGRPVPELDALAAELEETTDVTQVAGGLAVLGVDGVFVPGHGRSEGPAIKNLLLGAHAMVRRDFPRRVRRELLRAEEAPA